MTFAEKFANFKARHDELSAHPERYEQIVKECGFSNAIEMINELNASRSPEQIAEDEWNAEQFTKVYTFKEMLLSENPNLSPVSSEMIHRLYNIAYQAVQDRKFGHLANLPQKIEDVKIRPAFLEN